MILGITSLMSWSNQYQHYDVSPGNAYSYSQSADSGQSGDRNENGNSNGQYAYGGGQGNGNRAFGQASGSAAGA